MVRNGSRISLSGNDILWLLLTAAQANRDIQQFGGWRIDYIAVAGGYQAEFDTAMAELDFK